MEDQHIQRPDQLIVCRGGVIHPDPDRQLLAGIVHDLRRQAVDLHGALLTDPLQSLQPGDGQLGKLPDILDAGTAQLCHPNALLSLRKHLHIHGFQLCPEFITVKRLCRPSDLGDLPGLPGQGCFHGAVDLFDQLTKALDLLMIGHILFLPIF